MKLIKYITALALFMSLSNFAYASEKDSATPVYQVPFYNVAIAGGNKIYATYDFKVNKQTLVCKKTGDAIETIAWEYKNTKFKGQLPIVFKDNESFEGQWADPRGKLALTNVYHENDNILVTCEYRNMK